MEVVAELAPIFRLPSEGEEFDPFLGEGLLEDGKHPGELRENENPPSLFHHGRDPLHKEVHFRRGLRLLGGGHLEKLRMVADLTQLQQRIEHEQLTALRSEPSDFLVHLPADGGAHRLVELDLLGMKFDGAYDFRLRGQIVGHEGLGAPQHERGDALGETLAEALVPVLFNRHAKTAVEALLRPEESGGEKLKKRPELPKVIFNRRSGEAETMPGIDFPGNLGDLGCRVLDRVRLVEDDVVELLIQDLLGIPEENRV